MTVEQQRIKIAKACGWKHTPGMWRMVGRIKRDYNWVNDEEKLFDPPDYLNDLNAMHEAFMSQTQETRDKINHTLMESLEFESAQMTRTGQTADHAAAVDAFLSKEKPVFEGR